MGALTGSVPVHQDGETTWYGPEDELPEDVAAKIGEHAFEDGEHPYPEARAAFVDKRDGKPETPAGPTPPPLAGAGSSKAAWSMYADEVGVDLTDVEDKQAAIIQAIRDAGKPVERTASE